MANKGNIKGQKKKVFNVRRKGTKRLRNRRKCEGNFKPKNVGNKLAFTRKLLRKARQTISIRDSKTNKIHIVPAPEIDGSRIINLNNLRDHVSDISMHSATCEKNKENLSKHIPTLTIMTEERHGLASVLSCKFTGCGKVFRLCSSEEVTSSVNSGKKLKEINVRAVWGTMATGGGYSSLHESMGTLGVPVMSERQFTKIEQQIGEWWNEVLIEEMEKAAEEEKKFAIENDDFFQGVPAITVICDGGWSKRTHKHSYNAMAGVGVIFGAHTKKLLNIGIRNKLCYVCSVAKSKNEVAEEHECFKNWEDSSLSMEKDILVEGFLKCEETYVIRYMRMIADGDSSVYASIISSVPVWGPYVQKLECANHATKCLRVNLEKLTIDRPHYKGKGKLSQNNIRKITIGVRCAIKNRSQEKDRKKAIKLLKHDIRNAERHVLGDHTSCSEFCKNRTDVTENIQTLDEVEDDNDHGVLINQSEYWNTTDIALDTPDSVSELDPDLIKDIYINLNRMAEKSDRLIGNFTSNLAESWMHIRCKFDGGKFTNKCFKAGFYGRCYGASLRSLLGPAWSPQVYKRVVNANLDTHFISTYRRRSKKYTNNKKVANMAVNKVKRLKRKLDSTKSNSSKKAKLDYGAGILIDTKDLSETELNETSLKYYNNDVNISTHTITRIEKETRAQSDDDKWKCERKKRLTSSNFGEVMTRSLNNNSNALVKRLMYSTFKGNKFTIKGLAEETNARTEYRNNNPSITSIEIPGLVIDQQNPFLATTPDGILIDSTGPVGLLEIKTLLQTNKILIAEAAEKEKSFCLVKTDDTIRLKKNHKFYYQIQGQMNILNFNWCDLLIRRVNPNDMFVERIYRDKDLWENKMVPKMKKFYFTHILPELAAPRHGTITGVRKPSLPWYDDSSIKLKQKATVTRKKKRPSTHLSHTPSPLKVQAAEPTRSANTKKHACISQPFVLPSDKKQHDSSSTCVTVTSSVDAGTIAYKSDKEVSTTFIQPKSTDVKKTTNSVDVGTVACSSDNGLGVSTTVTQQTLRSTDFQKTTKSKRSRKVKFLGRRIIHKWTEPDGYVRWYNGTVLSVRRGVDGNKDTVHQVFYEEDRESYDIDSLFDDYSDGSVKFSDI